MSQDAKGIISEVYICTLTLEPVENPVATCIGQVYEGIPLRSWMAKQKSEQLADLGYEDLPDNVLRMKDPNTGLWVPFRCYSLKTSKPGILTKTSQEYLEYLRRSDESRGDFHHFSSRRLAVTQTQAIQRKLLDLKENDAKIWNDCQLQVTELICSGKVQVFAMDTDAIDQLEELKKIPRPENCPAKRFQFLDFTRLSRNVLRDMQWKSLDLRGSCLRNLIIRDSYCGRINLTACDLRNTSFINVNFDGDETCFEGCLMNKETTFVNCSIEPLDSWNSIKEDGDLVKHCLVARGADPCCTVGSMSFALRF